MVYQFGRPTAFEVYKKKHAYKAKVKQTPRPDSVARPFGLMQSPAFVGPKSHFMPVSLSVFMRCAPQAPNSAANFEQNHVCIHHLQRHRPPPFGHALVPNSACAISSWSSRPDG